MLGDSDYIDLFLAYFPMFDGCLLLQTTDSAVTPVPVKRVVPKLESIPEEETTDELESKQSRSTPSAASTHFDPDLDLSVCIENPEPSAFSYTKHSPAPTYSYFDF